MEQQNNNEGIEKVEKLIEAGEYGEIDYQWNGKKILKDNIKFKRNEFFELLGIAIQSKQKDVLKILDEVINNNSICVCGHNKKIHNWNMVKDIDGKTRVCYHNWEQCGCNCKRFKLDSCSDIEKIRKELKIIGSENVVSKR